MASRSIRMTDRGGALQSVGADTGCQSLLWSDPTATRPSLLSLPLMVRAEGLALTAGLALTIGRLDMVADDDDDDDSAADCAIICAGVCGTGAVTANTSGSRYSAPPPSVALLALLDEGGGVPNTKADDRDGCGPGGAWNIAEDALELEVDGQVGVAARNTDVENRPAVGLVEPCVEVLVVGLLASSKMLVAGTSAVKLLLVPARSSVRGVREDVGSMLVRLRLLRRRTFSLRRGSLRVEGDGVACAGLASWLEVCASAAPASASAEGSTSASMRCAVASRW